MLTGEVKKLLIEVVQTFVKDFQEKRAQITEDDVKHFMQIRKINPFPKRFQDANVAYEATAQMINPPKEEDAKK